MPKSNLLKLAELISNERAQLLSKWRVEVRRLPGAADLDTPTINDEIPTLLDGLAECLRKAAEEPPEKTDTISAEHGLLRFQAGFDITEVVAEYNILRECLQTQAEDNGLFLAGKALQIVNRIFDEAVGKAVKAFETMVMIELRHRHEEHIAFLLHDLRSPLDALGLATLVLDRALLKETRNDKVEHALRVLRGNVDRIADRVRQVLHGKAGLGNSFQAQFINLNLRDHIEKLIHDFEPLAAAAKTTITNGVPSELEIYSDSQLVTQLFQNLLSNAIRFTHEGGIEISARRGESGVIECSVKDSGIGIEADRLERIFDRFETAGENEKRGIGLGLAIVKEVVELHNGEIRVESQIGQGSIFTVVIPGPPE